MSTLSLSAKNRRERYKANPAPKVGSRKISKPVQSHQRQVVLGEQGTYALRDFYYADEQRNIQGDISRRCVDREMAVFHKILTCEADLAEYREILKHATDENNLRLAEYAVKEVSRLERKLCRLRGIKDPNSRKRTGRVFTPKWNGYVISNNRTGDVRFRSRNEIAQDKWEDMQTEARTELWDKARYIATLEGFTEGTVAHLQATANAVESIRMIERLQAFEDTMSRHAHHAEDQLRYEHFCRDRD
jgi:hypothetical protein